ncbi:short-chain dehydrogenase/reductase SDR [Penicillium alfredii]|uniref:Short-chain dehydrogenase/reductase SDR n=1 Tax=Penicillium alfredii TaxID=1506179 RepID=A0A9W9F9M6_9EURO|nr:short-chain dehydrogenase/reductase SDR [Penicillium alfredii]KAJ5096114.1 short-chain dehydrogenase/reductase SDR [Penicillium alfredii]
MNSLLSNKVIAITGSSSRIGQAIATACAQHGANLVLHHLGPRTEKAVYTLQDKLSTLPQYAEDNGPVVFSGDLTTEHTAEYLVQEAVSTFGRLDGLINTVAICNFMPAQAVTRSILQQHLDTNFVATYLLAQAATTRLTHQGHGGSIVNVSSITALLGSAHLTHYAPAKAAVLGMTTSFATEFGKYGIRYNCVLPGAVDKNSSRGEEGVRTDERRSAVADTRIPLARLGTPDDVAGAAVFLVSDLSAYMTGQHLVVDGGASVHYHPTD